MLFSGSFLRTFCFCIKECPRSHWPSIVSLIQDREDYLAQEKIVYFFDDRSQTTYYLAKADVRITLVAIFKGKKNERDSYIVNVLQGWEKRCETV